jgi:hypothetical protein
MRDKEPLERCKLQPLPGYGACIVASTVGAPTGRMPELCGRSLSAKQYQGLMPEELPRVPASVSPESSSTSKPSL